MNSHLILCPTVGAGQLPDIVFFPPGSRGVCSIGTCMRNRLHCRLFHWCSRVNGNCSLLPRHLIIDAPRWTRQPVALGGGHGKLSLLLIIPTALLLAARLLIELFPSRRAVLSLFDSCCGAILCIERCVNEQAMGANCISLLLHCSFVVWGD